MSSHLHSDSLALFPLVWIKFSACSAVKHVHCKHVVAIAMCDQASTATIQTTTLIFWTTRNTSRGTYSYYE